KRIMLFSTDVRQGSVGEIQRAWHAPAPWEKLQDIEKEISLSSQHPGNQVPKTAFRTNLSVRGEIAEFEIECRPESTQGERALLVEYEFHAASAGQSFKNQPGSEDWYEVTFKFPYRNYSAKVIFDELSP